MRASGPSDIGYAILKHPNKTRARRPSRKLTDLRLENRALAGSGVSRRRIATDKAGHRAGSLSALKPDTCRRQSSMAARTRSVTSAAVAFHSNGMEISNARV
jgi:hypothetical protein